MRGEHGQHDPRQHIHMSEAKAVRKHSAQHDLFHRLHSVAADERFVRKVASDWYSKRLEVVGKFRPTARMDRELSTEPANQRCGNWYCDPSVSDYLDRKCRWTV